ncbi:hypothetical protein BT93_B2597 [Corymbia citriodora subsp. variegata]|nr:hypothetical protein BT93_B2597 [Corymbia citriodora subsp. variegata]
MMNGGNDKIWRGAEPKVGDSEEFDFRPSGKKGLEDPPSKLIGEFLHNQQASGDFSLDIDLVMQELKQDDADDDFTPLPSLEESPLKSRNKVSFHEPSSSDGRTTRVSVENQQRQQDEESEDGQVLKAEEEEEKIAVEVEKLQKAGAVIPPDLNAAVLPAEGSGRVQKSPRGKDKGEEGITIDQLHKLSSKNVSAWNMKRLINLARYGNLTTLDEQISSHDDESSNQINSEGDARAAAKKIFQNVARQGSSHIYLEDLMRFMPEDEAVKTMSLFEGASESQRISKSSLENCVVYAFRERRALALTPDDTKTAVNKLHWMVNILVAILIAVIWLLMFGIATKNLLLLVSFQLLLVVIFQNSCKTTFEAIIFFFVIHPFDVGDHCKVDGVQMVVEEMNILTTVFRRYDNLKTIIPNSVLATKPIGNYYRSPDMGDAVEFCVHISTPTEKIATMKQRITSYIENKKDHWYPAPMIIFKDVEDLNERRIVVWLTHRMNHQDMGEKWARRALLVEEMVKIFKELDIQYRLLPSTSTSVLCL